MVTFPKKNSNALMRAFSLLISNGKLSKFAEAVAFSGKQLAKNLGSSSPAFYIMEEVLKSLQLLNLGSSSPTFYIMSLLPCSSFLLLLFYFIFLVF